MAINQSEDPLVSLPKCSHKMTENPEILAKKFPALVTLAAKFKKWSYKMQDFSQR